MQICVRACVCVCVFMYVFVYACVRVCVCVCVCQAGNNSMRVSTGSRCVHMCGYACVFAVMLMSLPLYRDWRCR